MAIQCRPSQPFNGIMLIGEAPGEEEEKQGIPFVGASGKLLREILRAVGIAPEACWITNVFSERPPGNKLDAFCGKKAEVGGKDYTLPPLSMGKYVRPEYLHNLSRLQAEISECNPNVIVALGNTPLWALTGAEPKIGRQRGYVQVVDGRKVLPTFHPAYILRTWGDKPLLQRDLMKALKESRTKEYSFPERRVLIDPTYEEILSFEEEYILPAPALSVDIETYKGQISCIGFAPSPFVSICIPYIDWRKPSRSYWPTLEAEVAVRKVIQEWLTLDKTYIFQNGSYDIVWLHRDKYTLFGEYADTMIMHHAMQPELPKGLEFLGSIYCDIPSWKGMRKKHMTEMKADE